MSKQLSTTNLFDIIRNIESRISNLEKALFPIENWRYIGESGQPNFENSWVNYNTSTHQSCAFYKDSFGTVKIKGSVSTGTINTNIFTLPVGYRPLKRINQTILSNGAFGVIQINSDGSVICTVGNNTIVALDNIAFRAEG